ncbi:hypothetical protein ACXR2T_13050 [Leucobacter sp. HY1910]
MSTDAAANTGTRATSVPSIERATGRTWASWLELFAAQGAEKLGHAAIAKIARAALPDDLQSVDWWAQGVAIAFEQHTGLRVPGQGSDGLFRVSASRTLVLDRDAAIDAWVAVHGGAAEHRGFAVQKPRRSRTEKRSFWRFDLDGMGRVEVSATPKGDDRVTLSVNHDGMPSGEEVEQWRVYWKGLLAAI